MGLCVCVCVYIYICVYMFASLCRMRHIRVMCILRVCMSACDFYVDNAKCCVCAHTLLTERLRHFICLCETVIAPTSSGHCPMALNGEHIKCSSAVVLAPKSVSVLPQGSDLCASYAVIIYYCILIP